MNLMPQQDIEINKSMEKTFLNKKQIQLQIKPDENSPLRLTQSKISMFCNGFNLTTGIAEFPTYLNIHNIQFKEDTGKFHIKGKLRDNDNPEYFLSLEIIEGQDRIKCGYNKTGDDVELILCKFVKQTENKMYYLGEVKVSRDSCDYYLQKSQSENDANIMKKANWGEEFILIFKIIKIDYQINTL